MRAVIITAFGEPEVLQVKEVDTPVISSSSQLCIQVKAIGVNRPDIFQRKGNYPAPEGTVVDIPGLEVAGVVVKVGRDVKEFAVGDRVMALVSGGGYAELVVADEGVCLSIPDDVTDVEAASLPENLFTVWHNVFERGQLRAGENFLVHGGSGGIGYTAIQLAKIFGATVFTTVGSEEKELFVRGLGADYVIQYAQDNFAAAWSAFQMDVVLDSIGGDYFAKNISLLCEDGRLVYINAIHGAKVSVNLLKLMQKRITLTGSTLRARDIAFKSSVASKLKQMVMPVIAAGGFKFNIDRVFKLEEASLAHRYMESGDLKGKIVLVCD